MGDAEEEITEEHGNVETTAENGTLERQLKAARLKRAVKKRAFSRKYNIFKEAFKDENALIVLTDCFKEVCESFEGVEKANDIYMLCLSEQSEDEVALSAADEYITQLEKMKMEIKCLYRKLESKKGDEVSMERKLKVKALQPPGFDGDIKKFPNFLTEYERLMGGNYGKDAYALRSCLSGEALEVVKGVEGDYEEMMARLHSKYGDNRRLIDVVVNELKGIKLISEGDHKSFINMVHKVETNWLSLKKMDLQAEMNTTSMVSYIERVLPLTQRREWIIVSEANRNSKELFKVLLTYLLKEKKILEHLHAEVRSNTVTRGGACNNAVGLVKEEREDDVAVCIRKLTENQLEMQKNFEKMRLTVEGNSKSGTYESSRGQNNVKCPLHEFENHNLADCSDFKKLSNSEKSDFIKKTRVCFLCLKTNHMSKYCFANKRCNLVSNDKICNRYHHPLLHGVFSEGLITKLSNSLKLSNSYSSRIKVLLMVSELYSRGHHLNTLWDPGSDVTMITFDAASRLGLRGKDISLSITKLGNKTETIRSKEYIVPLTDKDGNLWSITAFGISEITSPVEEVDVSDVVRLFHNVKVSDLNRPVGKMDFLVGSDWCMLMPKVQQTADRLQLMKNMFGFCLRGSHPSIKFKGGNTCNLSKTVYHVACVPHAEEIKVQEESRDKLDIAKFFDIESLGTYCNPRCGGCKCGSCAEGNKNYSLKEEKELDLISSGLIYNKDKKRWSVKYPWIKDPNDLPNNVAVALAQMKSTEKRLQGLGPCYTDLYNDQIRDMINRKVAKKLEIVDMKGYNGPVHYIHHHEIMKPESDSTPIRIVFNSSFNYKGHKLNDYWAKGPDMLNELVGIMIRFRQGLVAIVGDLSKMYNSVAMEELEQHTHRFVWRDADGDKAPEHYVLTAVGFGDRPSGIIATLALRKTAELKEKVFPEVKLVIERSSYVDDIVHSLDSQTEAERLMNDINIVLAEGGFKIKHWIMSGNETSNEILNLLAANEEKVLGLNWDSLEDKFVFKIKLNFSKKYKNVREEQNLSELEINEKLPTSLTRRSVYSQVQSIYDPMGLIVPFTLGAKILMRELITMSNNINSQVNSWDLPMSELLREKWKGFFREMFELEKICFRRCVKPQNYVGNPMLIIFSDASMLAYGACVYIRWKLSTGGFKANLLMAKNKIAPARQLTMPRLEMCGAVLSCRLRSTIERHCNWNFDSVVHITDSSIVRAQIQKESYGFGIFVANRIAEIQNKSSPNEWYWTRSEHNPADMTTRYCNPRLLDSDSIWQNGPPFLSDPFETWPISQSCEVPLPDVIEDKSTCLLSHVTRKESCVIDVSRFSNYDKLLRVTARIFSVSTSKSLKTIFHSPSTEAINKAEEYLIKSEQSNLEANWKEKYQRLGPSLSNGILFVGERIANWLKENWNRDRFVLMPRDSKLMNLYIGTLHNIDHGGVESTLAKLQGKFWVIGARKLIKSIKDKCVVCRRLNEETVQQRMGQVISERLNPTPPFFSTSCDLFGPLSIRDAVKRRTFGKAYGIIFTCLVTRAVYIDLSESYDTKGFLAVFRRFAMIRGYPKNMYSDQGTQLVAASKEIKNEMPVLNLNEISNSSNTYGTNWNFNKSADAPWQNGCSEALIKSIKRSLQISIGDSKFTFGEMQTVLFEVANLLNERPIGIKPGVDIELGTYLCPNDLLLGRTSVKAPSCSNLVDKGHKNRLEFMERIANGFWKKWHRDYFPTLIIRQKWHVDKRNVSKGDIVIVQDANSVRGQWKLAQVVEVESSRDGKVRDVTLRYKLKRPGVEYKGQPDVCLKRSVHRIVVLLPAEEFELL